MNPVRKKVSNGMKRILVVDDEKPLRELIERILRKEGYEVLEAATTKEALKLIQEADLLLLDLRLPDGDGLELLRRIRRVDEGLPIIIITAYGSLKSLVDAMALNAYHYIPKPFNIGTIKETVKEALSKVS